VSFHEQVHVIGHDLKRYDPPAILAGFLADQLPATGRGRFSLHRATALGAPHSLVSEVVQPISGNLRFPDHTADDTHRLCQTARLPCLLKMALPSRGD
jgi:hypothetical protein